MNPRVRTWLVLSAGALLGSLATVGGLARAGRLSAPRPEVVVVLAQTLEVEHRRVDVLEDQDRIAEAIAALEAVRTRSWPDFEAGGAVALELRHDVYGRLLRLHLDHPEVSRTPPEALLALAREGLEAGGDAPSASDPAAKNPFTARLHAIEGEVLEQLGRDDEALAAYDRALTINRELLERELGSSR